MGELLDKNKYNAKNPRKKKKNVLLYISLIRIRASIAGFSLDWNDESRFSLVNGEIP